MFSHALRRTVLKYKSFSNILRNSLSSVGPNSNQNLGFSVLRVDENGTKTSLFVPMIQFLKEKMHARDLLTLGISHKGYQSSDSTEDVNEVRPSPPLLLPRRNSIIASFGTIKSIIYTDHILIIGISYE